MFFVAIAAGPARSRVVDDGILIEDVTLISPERPIPMVHASVLIRDGRIAEIGTRLVAGLHAKKVDGRGRFLIPGLIDTHVHVGNMGPLDEDAIDAHPELLQAYRAQLPRAYLAFGFTTLVDLDLRDETLSWFDAAPLHPSLYHCGRGVHIVGGYGAFQPPVDDAAARSLNIVYQAARPGDWPAGLDPKDHSPARVVDRVAQTGAICVKTFLEPGFGGAADWPLPRAETLDALRAEARKRGLTFVIHANSVDSWRTALHAHCDVIAHGLWHWPGDRLGWTPPDETRDVIRAAARAGVGVQPTVQSVYGDQSIFDRSLLDNPRLAEALPRIVVAYLKSGRAKASAQSVADAYRKAIVQFFGQGAPDAASAMSIGPARASATLRIMETEKVKLLFGSDTPANEGIGNPPGLNGRFELSRWSEAGVPLSRILRAATLDNAVAFGLAKDRGTIEVGKRADLLLLRSDPLKSIDAYDTIDTIFLAGSPIPRASLVPTN